MKKFSVNTRGFFKSELIDVLFIEYSYDETEHIHDGIELIYITDGIGTQFINGDAVNVKKGSLIVMDKNCEHSFKSIKPMKYYNVMFLPQLFNTNIGSDADINDILNSMGFDMDIKRHYAHIDISEYELQIKTESLFADILKEGIEHKSGNIYMASLKVGEVLGFIARNYRNEEKRVKRNDDFEEVMEYIDEHCCEKMQLPEVAKVFGYDKDYFSRMIKKNCGLSFKQLIINKRIVRSMEYLWTTNESIDDIISKCGFSNKTFFYKTFESVVGVLPRTVRDCEKNYYAYLKVRFEMDKPGRG